ncbi:MAG: flagellar basal body rod protein [Alphaproteobacteria bacterium]|nr:flagellar basal body rod protein [Alphaproteobacteria bacterium]
MIDASKIALTGLNAAERRLSVSAHNTANATTPNFTSQRVVQSSVVEGGVRTDVVNVESEGVSLEEEAIEQNLSTYTYKANLKVLKVQQELDQALLDINA